MRKTKSNLDQASSRLLAFVLGAQGSSSTCWASKFVRLFELLLTNLFGSVRTFPQLQSGYREGQRERKGEALRGHGAFSVPTIEQTYVSRIRHA